jgi:hypothetical protein
VVFGEDCDFEIIQDHLEYNRIYLYHIGIIAKANSPEGVCQPRQIRPWEDESSAIQ